MKRSAMRNIIHVLCGRMKPRPVQSGGHSTIPIGKIIAKPRSDGGYSLFTYYGTEIGWMRVGDVSPGGDVQKAMSNLARPVETYTPQPVVTICRPKKKTMKTETNVGGVAIESTPLLECPFCGMTPTLEVDEKIAWVLCPQESPCRGSGHVFGFKRETLAAGLKLWNTRHYNADLSGGIPYATNSCSWIVGIIQEARSQNRDRVPTLNLFGDSDSGMTAEMREHEEWTGFEEGGYRQLGRHRELTAVRRPLIPCAANAEVSR